ncbi:response regulator transcription factor [Myceligenerans pegani]|uniref:Response regulator transcription factor n=1 Tax=Myceligenerans pegani TaxID=2776917 RepID=A0ABR9MUG6_9MICO|nr:response regulator transcription factor [Myceligenerans sp. TRM 65318]MBE1875012.1 response regulator transcription factor [Myceligenerans sp. TRM 65318]MBE3017283.1 response regulator transcription factor [Myceligenerans sp. TRM 65318]
MPSTARTTDGGVTVVRGEEEVFRRTAHLFADATSITCAANTLSSWGWTNGPRVIADGSPHDRRVPPRRRDARIRKVYRSGMLLDPSWPQRMATVLEHPGAEVRISTDEVNETIILDGRLAILAGDQRSGERSYSLITRRETVHGISALFEAAWRSATDLDVYDAGAAEIRRLAPQVLDLLGRGVKDEAAARELGLGVRTYRRRVAELMAALGADSRFQAGVRARELGLV